MAGPHHSNQDHPAIHGVSYDSLYVSLMAILRSYWLYANISIDQLRKRTHPEPKRHMTPPPPAKKKVIGDQVSDHQ